MHVLVRVQGPNFVENSPEYKDSRQMSKNMNDEQRRINGISNAFKQLPSLAFTVEPALVSISSSTFGFGVKGTKQEKMAIQIPTAAKNAPRPIYGRWIREACRIWNDEKFMS